MKIVKLKRMSVQDFASQTYFQRWAHEWISILMSKVCSTRNPLKWSIIDVFLMAKSAVVFTVFSPVLLILSFHAAYRSGTVKPVDFGDGFGVSKNYYKQDVWVLEYK